ncbi:twin-arginine translocase TatA/TatE family subunit [Legionella jamestowniensis]|uniref:Preprotein translocase subunit TatB n=1 Tax=Legionella jamestowniensis TaxID=455 RepID=A0A0W0UIX8_9GAMM|nr:twin-arginine translocase TatA/TatE family subunit [Legionella jamestowniensis]KTD07802.1 TatB protein (twin arginine translocation) [Legionella jamestowniensis]OCH99534.1 preprotein translocase subunit TatB [Legionella jamestowniensis]SFL62382.1 sec-independent protein translocase protein TatB [Legionella jamestowniensis DSM 19215]
MSSSELLLILLVAVVVFGPNKLPMLAEHLAKLFRHLNQFKQQAKALWQAQLNEQQLIENTRKAEKVDALYKVDKKNTEDGIEGTKTEIKQANENNLD